MSVTLKVAELTPRCLTQNAGRLLLARISADLQHADEVYVDFSGLTMFASLFFNNSFAELLRKHPPEFINTHIHIVNLVEAGQKAFKRSMENAEVFFKLNESEQSKIIDIVEATGDHENTDDHLPHTS